MKTKQEKVYITFQTHPMTSDFLKMIANKMGKTQPELINEICEDYIESCLEILEDKGLLKETDLD